MHEQAARVAVSFDDEGEAAEALKDAQRRFPGKVHASVEDPVDRGVGGARRRQEAQDVIVGPSYAMTNEQAKRGALGMVAGAAVLGLLTMMFAIPIAMAGTISVTTAVLVVLAALMGGGTIGVIMGGRSGGKEEQRRDDKNHQRRVVVQIDTASPGEAAAAREMLNVYRRGGADHGNGGNGPGDGSGETDEAPSGTDERPHGPITHRSPPHTSN